MENKENINIDDNIIQQFLSTKKYKHSCVHITLEKKKYRTVDTFIGCDELLKDFVDYIKQNQKN